MRSGWRSQDKRKPIKEKKQKKINKEKLLSWWW